MPFDTKKDEAAAEETQNYENPPPPYQEHVDATSSQRSRHSQSLSASPLPPNSTLTFFKKGITNNMLIESPSGPLLYATVHSSFSTPENPTIKISQGSKPNSSIVATADFITMSSNVVVRLPGDSHVAPAELQPGGICGRGYNFMMVLNGHTELLEWKQILVGASTRTWLCIRCDNGDVLVNYEKAGHGLDRKMGEAKWTAEATEMGLAEGETGMMIVATLVAVLEQERRKVSLVSAKSADAMLVGFALPTMQYGNY